MCSNTAPPTKSRFGCARDLIARNGTRPTRTGKTFFNPDPLLPKNQRAELVDYKGSKLDRGHQAPAGDFRDQDLKNQSFFLSNMAPQSPPLNQVFWRLLEDRVRNLATATFSHQCLYRRFFLRSRKKTIPPRPHGQVTYRRIGPDQVAVPTHFYKIAFGKDEKGAWRAVGFVVENRGYEKGAKFEAVIKSIDWIEARTGITFMPDLDDAVAAKLKRNPGQLW